MYRPLWVRFWVLFLITVSVGPLLLTPVLTPVLAQSDERETAGETIILLPSIRGESVSAPSPLPQEDGPVFGLLGTLLAAQGQPFSTYLVLADPNDESGRRIGLVGETPDLEARITALRDQQPEGQASDSQVKVWGVYLAPQNAATEPRVVASDIIPASATAPGVALPMAVVKFDRVNLRQGPGNRFPHDGQATQGETCVIVNRTEVGTWYFIDCPGDVAGWIDRRLVDVNGNADRVPIVDEIVAVQPAVPVPTPLPASTPTPVPTPDLPPTADRRGEYYANPQLVPPLQFQQNVGEINFQWGTGSPNPSIPNDGFSARFDRTFDFGYGYYRFAAQSDDGVRVYLDDQLIIDEWHGATQSVYSVGRTLSGRHVVKVEYYEVSGDANLKLEIEFKSNDPIWTASYFGGVDLLGAPVLEQREARGDTLLDYNWGNSSPAPGVLASDFWSARWIGKFKFNSGNYVFRVNADDGVRVYLNDTKVIDDLAGRVSGGEKHLHRRR